ncbi:MAG: 2Fe-2S iron-sulfur cluster-binding protein [Desulfobacterales bacterium]|nr:2Fe-2S iron-sulfur cluster-binding protein [Desulfobacterales bacterium]
MPADTDLAGVKVFKFDPAVDDAPRYAAYEVPYQGATVLQVLRRIYRQFDPLLAFRWGCEGAGDCRCGACALLVNGRPALSCRKAAEAHMVIEPHFKFEIIRDLVVDFNAVRKDIARAGDVPVKISIDPGKCVQCADCITLCPVGVYEARKGVIVASGPEYCCDETCRQCVTYCYQNAIQVKTVTSVHS